MKIEDSSQGNIPFAWENKLSLKIEDSSQGNIPFAWENKPGVRKDSLAGAGGGGGRRKDVYVTKELGRRRRKEDQDIKEEKRKLSMLPPPPCEKSSINYRAASASASACQDIGLPLPPCTFQPPFRSLSRRRSKDDDPFLMAYKECTKNDKKGTLMRNHSFLGSCKYSCSVRDDSIVRVSHIPPMSNSDTK